MINVYAAIASTTGATATAADAVRAPIRADNSPMRNFVQSKSILFAIVNDD